MGNKVWVSLSKTLENSINDLMKKCSVPRAIAILLATRSVKPENYDSFVKSPLSNLSDPYRFPGMEKSVARLWDAIKNREIILIHGDYDTDGITATSLLSYVLQSNGAEVFAFLPHRFEDGYGFTAESLLKAIEASGSKCKVLVTVDCGINSIDAVKAAEALGIDVIITDHHEPSEEKPKALGIINPKLYTELEDMHLLSGAGVAFKLSHAFIKYGREHNLGGFTTKLEDILDLVALGTIADIVPLLGENRILVKHGIKILKKQLRPGVRALIEMSRIDVDLKPSDITFKLAPRLNAAGRLGDANAALDLLNSGNIVDAYRYAEMLEKYNALRQEKEQEIFSEAKKQIDETIDVANFYSIVVSGVDWHQGVIGIVASRLARDYNRPVIVLSIQGDEAQGSGRSIGNLNLVNVLIKSAHLLNRFGGHPMAVGLGLHKDNIQKFYKEFEKNVRIELKEEDLIDHINFDGEILISDIDKEFFTLMEQLGPFGHSNSLPHFRLNNLECVKTFSVGGNHTRGTFRDKNNNYIDFIAFKRSADSLPKTEIDIIATPQLNEYYGEPKPQLQVLDLRPSY